MDPSMCPWPWPLMWTSGLHPGSIGLAVFGRWVSQHSPQGPMCMCVPHPGLTFEHGLILQTPGSPDLQTGRRRVP